jgi:hypothetical protein
VDNVTREEEGVKMKVTFYAHADPGKVAGVVKALKVKTKLLPPVVPGKDETNGGSCCLFCGKWGCYSAPCPVLRPIIERAKAHHLHLVEKGLPLPGTVEYEESA